MSEYAPGTYVKNGRPRIAHTAAEAVALVFDGYKFAAPEVPVATLAPEPEVADPDVTAALASIEDEKPETPKPTPPKKKD